MVLMRTVSGNAVVNYMKMDRRMKETAVKPSMATDFL